MEVVDSAPHMKEPNHWIQGMTKELDQMKEQKAVAQEWKQREEQPVALE